MKYYIFNPDTEMAMASGLRNYTPPANVRGFINRLSLLPSLYASDDAVILVGDGKVDYSLLPYYNIVKARGLSIAGITGLEDGVVSPWGWNISLKHRLKNAGLSDSCLPSDASLEQLRRLAHRSTTIKVLQNFDEIRDAGLLPVCITDTDEAVEFVASGQKDGEGIVVKLPWSSSGRGVFFNPEPDTVRKAMSRQGSVMIEPMWDKTFDFATEWECRGAQVVFRGFSVFDNAGGGRYKGNLVASPQYLHDYVCRYCEADKLDSLIARLKSALEQVVSPYYEGPLGVDMLCDTHGNINPCVELNLRMTMGHVALSLYDRYGAKTWEPYYFYPGAALPIE